MSNFETFSAIPSDASGLLQRLNTSISRVSLQKEVYWCAPRENQVNLNMEGSCIGNPGPGAGGLLRNHCGELLFGFYESLGDSTSFHAELVDLSFPYMGTWLS